MVQNITPHSYTKCINNFSLFLVDVQYSSIIISNHVSTVKKIIQYNMYHISSSWII